MKKICIFTLVLIITLLTAVCAQGAVHSQTSPFQPFTQTDLFMDMYEPETSAWYSLSEPEKGFDGSVVVFSGDNDAQIYQAQYFESDMKFGSADLISSSNSDEEIIKGNYLFNFGLVIGAEMFFSDSYNSQIISPGYYFKFDKGFAQISMDYLNEDEQSDIYGYELDVMYNLDKARIFGEVYSLNEDNATYFMIGGLHQINDNLTLGGKFRRFSEFKDSNDYELGATWDQDALILNGRFGQSFFGEYSYYAIGGTYNLNERLSIGLDYGKNETMDAGYALRLNYKTESFIFKLSLNKDYILETTLR